MAESQGDSGDRQEDGQGTVRFERDGAVATLTFARPHARNAMTWTMYDELQAACRELREDRTCRVVVLRGEGGEAFVAGTDIAQFSGFSSGEDGIAYEERMEAVFADLESLPQPTVAVVEGFAVGSGLLMASICDLRIATPSARFGMPVARTLGNCLSMRNYARLVSVLGASRVASVVMTASFIDAEAAHAAGFVTAVHQPEQLDAAIRELSGRLEQHAPFTMWMTKEALRRIRFAALPDGDDLVRAAFGSADFHEGVSAFVSKRSARWEWR
jgi:enoyl-CoA hydratase/carnithine racemase